jgi:hypothetical protein
MNCPLCPAVSELEQPVLAHLLRHHPRAMATASLALALGPVILRKRPDLLMPFYAVLLVSAFVIAADDR